MKPIDEILEFNKKFIADKQYEEFLTNSKPNKKMVLLSCMDTRLTELLLKAMNLKNGDVKLIKNAGASIMHPFGSVMRSIIIAIYQFEAKDIIVIGHHGCGMNNLNSQAILDQAISRGISPSIIKILSSAGVDLRRWLKGFSSVEDSVKQSVAMIKEHPLMPKDVFVHGMIIDPVTGKLDYILDASTLN